MATIRVANVTAQILFSPTVHSRSVNQSITWTQEPFRRKIRVANVTFQALMPGEPKIRGIASNDLGLQEDVIFYNAVGDREIPSNEIEWTQVANSPSFPQVFQEIIWTEVANTNLINRDPEQPLGLWDQAQVCFGTPWSAISVEDTLTLVDQASQAHPETVGQTISWVQTLDLIPGGTEQSLDLVQTVSAGFGYEASNELELVDTLDSESDFLRTVTQTDVVSQAFTYYIDNKCNQKSYAKFDGEGAGPGLDEKRLTWDGDFILETIGAETKTILELRSPETDDRDRLGFERVNRESRGGELSVFGDPDWSKVNTLLFTILAITAGQGNCPDKITALLDFFQDTLGEEIQLHDHTGVTWRGVVTTPNEAATEDGKGFWTVTFEFEGIALPGSSSDQAMIMSDTATRIMVFARPATDTIQWTESASRGGTFREDVSQSINWSETMGGTRETTILYDDFSGGGSNLDGTTPDTGTGTWRAHTNFKDDGSQSAGIDAGAYFAFTPEQGTVYECTWDTFTEVTASNSDNIIAGFYEGISSSNTITGDVANGTLDPTTLKAGHLRRDISGSEEHAYRLGNQSDGEVETKEWTNQALRESSSAALDMRITIDTTGGTGNWTATWEAKETASGSYTIVGPETSLLDENIGAVGWSNDNANTDMSISEITLKEYKPI